MQEITVKINPRYRVDVYRVVGKTRSHYFTASGEAAAFARTEFQKSTVYKAKVWDREKGPIEPNKQTAPGLILHLV